MSNRDVAIFCIGTLVGALIMCFVVIYAIKRK